MSEERIACVMIPDFPMAVCLRIDQSLYDKPVALVESDSESSLILAVNNIAASTGVSCKMTLARAKSYCPDIVVKTRDIKRETAASEKLRDLLFTASPLIEETEPGCFFLDASGLRWLYKDETELAQRLVSVITGLKMPVKVGIAKNKFVAGVAAEISPVDSFTVVPVGTERRFLNNLTIDYLPFSEDTRDKLLALGLKTIGQVAAFPSNEMTSRFADEGAVISRLSRGDDTDFFLPQFANVKLSTRVSLFEPLISTTAVIAHVEKALTGLLDKMNRNDQGCRVVDIRLHLESNLQMSNPRSAGPAHKANKPEQPLHLALKQTCSTPHRFIRKLGNLLSNYRLLSGVTDITITISEVLPLPSSQMELMATRGRCVPPAGINSEVRRIQLMSATINRAIIPDKNFSFRPLASEKHNDGQMRIPRNAGPAHEGESISGSETKSGDVCQYSLNPIAGLRLLSPAQKANVVACGKYLRQLKLKAGTKPIIKQKGPWELSGEWWKYGFDRLYYEVQTDDYQFYLLYFDCQVSNWYVQGVFD